MFLTRIISSGRDDRGSGLVAVIALTLVTAIIGVTVGAVTVHSLQTTNGVAGSIEARAAALSGVTDVEWMLRLRDGGDPALCPFGATGTWENFRELKVTEGFIEPGEAEDDERRWPNYSVEIFADKADGTWTDDPECPGEQSTRVKIIATGLADRATPGAGASGGEVVLEAIYQYLPQPTEIEVIDPAVYAYQIVGSLRNFELGIEPGTVIASDVQIRNGNFICTNGARVTGSVVLAAGRALLDNCNVKGDVHVSETIVMDGTQSGQFPARIEGNAIAAGRTAAGASISGNIVRLTKGTQVDGDVYAGGNVALEAPPQTLVGGNILAVRNTSTAVTLDNQSRVNGSILSTGTVNNRGTVVGTRSAGAAGLTPPPVPIVPEWVDLPFDPTDIQSSTWWERGFTNVVTWTGSCSLGGNDPRWDALDSYTTRTVIDATGCTNGVIVESSLSPTVSLRTDIAFFAKSFTFSKLPAEASNMTDPRRLYFIVPDNDEDNLPTCNDPAVAGDITYNNEATINAPLAFFLYSPCGVISDRNEMRGQIYGGTVEFRQQAQWTFVPATPPGIDFTAGGEVETVPGAAQLEKRLTIRELTTGG